MAGSYGEEQGRKSPSILAGRMQVARPCREVGWDPGCTEAAGWEQCLEERHLHLGLCVLEAMLWPPCVARPAVGGTPALKASSQVLCESCSGAHLVPTGC